MFASLLIQPTNPQVLLLASGLKILLDMFGLHKGSTAILKTYLCTVDSMIVNVGSENSEVPFARKYISNGLSKGMRR